MRPLLLQQVGQLGPHLADDVEVRRVDDPQPVDVVDRQRLEAFGRAGDVEQRRRDAVLQVLGQITGDGEAQMFEGVALIAIYVVLAVFTLYE